MTFYKLTTWILSPLSVGALLLGCSSGFETGAAPCEGDCGPGACMVDGAEYRDGAVDVPAGDGCNTCSCADGVASCTERACGAAGMGAGGGGNNNAGMSNSGGSGGTDGCEVDGVVYADGVEDIAAPDNCNTCSCVGGELLCTAIGCVSGACTYEGVFYEDGDSFPASDGCNTCSCSNGDVACTLIGCTEPTDCMVNEECGPDEMCQKAEGVCGGAGTCVGTFMACDLSYAPVCGCDGVTYGNACGAQTSGASVDYAGECGEPVTTCGNVMCESTAFCQYPTGMCNAGAGVSPAQDIAVPVPQEPGQCAVPPEACEDNYEPVCGCDGVTYSNECQAAASRMNIASAGECATVCYDNNGCGEEEFCQFPTGICGAQVAPGTMARALIALPSGTCATRSDGCPAIYSPVCGCDGVTYGNECAAGAEGVSVAYEGECGVAQ